ncbi:MAG: thioether cross-link-forming SCIFF peptide maturase [Ruminococcus sp.]|nr:thioether cross-link-forming SCIFF peptide maturase [Ruminococcus sp.]
MIHKFKQKDMFILLDTNSGGVHIIDELTYDLLDYVEPPVEGECPEEAIRALSGKYPEEELRECYAEMVSLYNDKILFSEDDYEKYALASVASPVKAMCLLIALDCNLRCEYCFAGKGDYGKGRTLMTYETGKKAIDFLIEKSANRKNLEIDFFGGEPLMNFEVVKQIVEYAREQEKLHNKNIRFTITTNGTLLTDDKIEFINDQMHNVVLSIDGRPEVNDRMRKTINGKGSYNAFIDKFKKLVETRGDKEWYVRGTYTKYNLDFTNDVMSLYNEGFEQISVEPVIADPSLPYALTEEDLPAIFSEYEKLADNIREIKSSGRFINFFHFMLDLDQGPCAIKRLRGCGCGNDYVAISPDGDIYPCHQFVGNDDYKMGSLNDGSFDTDMKQDFARAHVYTKPECRKCWAKFYCSGGCNANNYTFNKDIRAAYKLSCDIEKKRLECAIVLKAEKMMADAE